ncbi:MAG: TetR/AcrR family transcriptional regulator [Actinomycetota bacterium]
MDDPAEPRDEPTPERPYHHGDLRRALIDATFELIDERGLEATTLREVTRRAGVSHAAPYHHFADRSALLSAAAVESFELLAVHLRSAARRARGDGATRLKAVVVAYARFALEHRPRWRLLIEPEPVSGPMGAEVHLAATEVRERVGSVVQDAIEDGSLRADTNVETATIAVWSSMHGLTTLATGGLLGGAVSPSRADRAARAVAGTLLDGLRSPV